MHSVPCRNLELPISIQDSTKKQKYLDTYKVSTSNIHLPPLCVVHAWIFYLKLLFMQFRVNKILCITQRGGESLKMRYFYSLWLQKNGKYWLFQFLAAITSSVSVVLCCFSAVQYLAAEAQNEQNRKLGLSHQIKPYHYGSHYSNSGIVLHFLVRLPPFTNMFLAFQGDSFDIADRTFRNIGTTWWLSSSESATDVKELIPEFYFLPEFLENRESKWCRRRGGGREGGRR